MTFKKIKKNKRLKNVRQKIDEGHSSHHDPAVRAIRNRNNYFSFMLSLGVIAIVITFVIPFDSYDPNSMWSNIYALVREFANFAMPMFFFITGVEMVSKRATKNAKTIKRFYRDKIIYTIIPFLLWFIIGLLVYVGIGGYYKHFIYNLLNFTSFVPLYYLFAVLQLYVIRSFIITLAQTKKGLAFSFFISMTTLVCIELLRYSGVEIPFLFYGGLFITWLFFSVLGVYVRLHHINYKIGTLSTLMIIFWLLATIHTIYISTNEIYPGYAILPTKITSFLFSTSLILLVYMKKDTLRFHKYFANLGRSWLGLFFSSMIIWYIVLTIFNISGVPSSIYWVKILTIIGIIGISYAIGMILNSKMLPYGFGRKYFGF